MAKTVFVEKKKLLTGNMNLELKKRIMKYIRNKIVMAKTVFVEKKKSLTGNTNLELKKRITKCLVWSVALNVEERWTMTHTKED